METLLEQSSGSGSGLPFLVQKTIAKQLNIQESIGYGRFGEVYLATWNSDKVCLHLINSFCLHLISCLFTFFEVFFIFTFF